MDDNAGQYLRRSLPRKAVPHPLMTSLTAFRARGKRVAPNSVYRILDLFVASNLATRVRKAPMPISSTPIPAASMTAFSCLQKTAA